VGAAGPAGTAGATGSMGPQGATGAAGSQGATGAQGSAGATGPQGPPVANFTGNYVSSTNYGLHDAVSFGGSTYVSLVAGNFGNTPPLSPVQWAVLVAQGPAGPAGVQGPAGLAGAIGAAGADGATGPQGPPVTFSGQWLVGTSYAVGSAVSFAGSSYVALLANVGREPDLSPSYWSLLAQAGASGPAGATGATGAQGAVGVTYRGAWGSGVSYQVNDVVGFGGATYLAARSSLGAEPDVSPAAWAELAQNGGVGASGPAGAAATVSVGTVTTGLPGTQAMVTNSGTANAAVLNFTIPQGTAGANGTGGGGGGAGTSGIPFASIYHPVSFYTQFYSVNSSTGTATEGDSVLTWVPNGCTATALSVFSRQSNTVTVTLRQGGPTSMADTSLACSVASGGSCTATGSVVVAAGNFVDFIVTGASGTVAGVWVALGCN
jgi:hypothetical protein